MAEKQTFIYGKHILKEALARAPHLVDKVWCQGVMDPAIKALVRQHGLSIQSFDEKSVPRGVDKTVVHQGYIASVTLDGFVTSYKSFIQDLEVTPDTALVVLGELQDPHNVGAIIRSAAAFGISGVLMPEHRQASLTGTVVKVSAGTAFSVPLVQTGNVNAALEDLKKRGFWIYGLEGEGGNDITKETFDRPSVFVIGNEGAGIREKTREHCDVLLSIPMHERCESLNASVSAAVALYSWSTQHKGALN